MGQGLKPFAVLTGAAALLLALLAHDAKAYRWITDGQIRNRSADILWYYNPEHCPADALRQFRRAEALLNHSLLADFDLVYGGETGSGEGVDRRYVVQCSPILDYMDRGYSFQSGGVTLIARAHGLITDADIIFNADRMTFDIVLHEFTHLMGLDHSSVASSIVCHSERPGHCRSRSRLDADDLAGLAALYDVPANCTPRLDPDGSFYFPAIGGFWAELRPVDPQDAAQGYYPAAYGRALDHDWQCDLQFTGKLEKVTGTVYYEGRLMDVELRREGGRWFLQDAP